MSLTDGAKHLAKPEIMTDGTASKLGVQIRVGMILLTYATLDALVLCLTCNPHCTEIMKGTELKIKAIFLP